MNEQALIEAMNRLASKIDALAGSMGKGIGGNSKVPGSTKTAASGSATLDKAMKEVSKTFKAYQKQISDGVTLNKEQLKEYKKLGKQLGEFEDNLDDATDATKDLEKSMLSAKEAQQQTTRSVKYFGKDLLTGTGSMGDAFGGLARNLDTYGGIANKALFGFATGVSFALNAMSDFAKSAADVGTFASLDNFSVGSVRQMKLLSGLGDSFIKVIANSQGGFKAFGAGSQEATENLSQLARGFRSGSWWVSNSIKKNLGPEFVKDIDRAANASAALGLSTDDTANLMGVLAQSVSLGAKSEKDAQQKLAKAYADTVDSAKNLSQAFGISAKEVLASIEEFKKTQSGTLASLEGNTGAQNLVPIIKQLGLATDPEKIAAIARSMSVGDYAGAQYNTDVNAVQLLPKLFEIAQKSQGGQNSESLKQNLRNNTDYFEQFGRERTQGNMAAFNPEYSAPGTKALTFAQQLKMGERNEAGNAANKPGGTTEADNIKSMEQLTSALNSLRNTILGLTAAFIGFAGIMSPLIAGGIGALLFGGAGGISKLGSLLGGAFSKVADSGLGKVVGGVFTKGGGAASGVGSKIASSSIGKMAGGVFDKIGGAAGKGMEMFGDFLGKLGSSGALKGAGVLALLGGALALSAHGFKEFGEVKWEGILKGTLALGGLIVMARFVGQASTSMIKGAASIAILGAALWVSGKGFQSFNDVDWGSVVKGALALGVLAVAASAIGGLGAEILIGSVAIAALGAAMWVAGKGFQTFNDLDWGGIAKGAVALTVFGVAAGVMGMFLPAILLGAVAIVALGAALAVFGAGAYVAAKAAEVFAGALKTIGDISGINLIAIGAGLAAIGVGMIVFTAGMIAGTASSVITGIMSLFGAKSPLDRIKEFVPIADKISMIGDGILHFGQGIVQINSGLKDFNSDALKNFKDQLAEFAKTGASDEVRLTAQYLTAIGTALTNIGNVKNVQLPSLSGITDQSGAGLGQFGQSTSFGADVSSFTTDSTSALKPEVIAQVMNYLSEIHNDLTAIRSNTRTGPGEAPVRLS